jgi:hypothetical protein
MCIPAVAWYSSLCCFSFSSCSSLTSVELLVEAVGLRLLLLLLLLFLLNRVECGGLLDILRMWVVSVDCELSFGEENRTKVKVSETGSTQKHLSSSSTRNSYHLQKQQQQPITYSGINQDVCAKQQLLNLLMYIPLRRPRAYYKT